MTMYPVIDHRLSNGLRVVASPDKNAPSVAVTLTYGVGSRNDPLGRSGIAHLFEHLMFEGSGNVDAGEHMRLVQAAGGVCNAVTSSDGTVYLQQVPPGAVELVLWLEADRLATLPDALTQPGLDTQLQVALQERHQRLGQPGGSIHEHAFAALFGDHPYGHLPLGWPADLDKVTVGDLRGFFVRWYRPDNAVLAVVGDIDPEQLVDTAERYLAPVPARIGPTSGTGLPVIGEPPAAPRRVDVPEPNLPFALVTLAFRGPANSVTDPEIFAFHLAVQILADGEHSRAWRRLVHTEGLAQSISGTTLPMDWASAGTVTAVAMPGASADAIETALIQELETLAAKGPSEAELRQARAAATRDILAGDATLLGRATELGHFAASFDDPGAINTQIDRLGLADADAVQRTAAGWLHPDRRATITSRPTSPR